jgi:cob(I)alamin adenosyltransferase
MIDSGLCYNRSSMKIYTRTGDDGTTGLFGGQRTGKSDPRLDCVGSLDELNACLGLAAASATEAALPAELHAVQNDLFLLSTHLSAPEPIPSQLPALDDSVIGRLEMQIDAAQNQLSPLRQFILPGGTETAARLHLARTVCRRAERAVVAFSLDRPVSPIILTYLNRLSDWLFVQARLANHLAGQEDRPWEKPQPNG